MAKQKLIVGSGDGATDVELDCPKPQQSEHFRCEWIAEDKWRRLEIHEKMIAEGHPSAAPLSFKGSRPHIIPLTDKASKLIAYSSLGGARGEILVNGEWISAIRYGVLGDKIDKMLADADKLVEWYSNE